MNNWRSRIGLPYRSLSRHRAARPTGADACLRSFENALVDEARRKGFDGAICGHVHQPEQWRYPGPHLQLRASVYLENFLDSWIER
jgi:UDP-2,3-diacylglucosamine pyrophosphatase LpxH